MHDLAGVYAVDALPDDERRFFERHLADCATCQREVAELQATAAFLGSAATAPPPPGLRERVLADVRRTPQDHAGVADRVSSVDGEGPSGGGAAEERAGLADRLRQLLPAVAAVVVLTATGLTVLAVQTGPAGTPTEQQLAEVVAAPDARMVDLEAPEGTMARFVWSAQRGEGLLVTEGLEAAPEGHAYALWIIEADTPVLAGMFQPDERGHASHAVVDELDGADVVAVTVEQAEGTEAPTTDPLIHGAL